VRRFKCDIKHGFHNENDETAVHLIKTAVKEKFELMEKDNFYLRRFRFIYPTLSRCHVWARIRNRSPALHNPDYDFPDDIITTEYLFFHISKQITNAH
jgi:hypothetical protein